MKLTNIAMISLVKAINKFGNASGKTAYALVKTRRALQDELKDFTERQNEIIKKYGKEDKNGGWRIDKDDPEVMKKYNDEIMELLQFESDVNICQLSEDEFNIDEFPDDVTMTDYDLVSSLIVKQGKECGLNG